VSIPSNIAGSEKMLKALINEDLDGFIVHGSHAGNYYRTPGGRLTTRCYEYITGDKSDEVS